MCGLSRKQIWRRQQIGKPKLADNESTGSDFVKVSKPETDKSNMVVVKDTSSSAPAETVTSVPAAETVKEPAARRISFCPSVVVILIPSLREYKDAFLCESLWWNAIDYKYFHRSTTLSIKKFMVNNGCKDPKKALKLMLMSDDDHDLDGSIPILPKAGCQVN